MDMDNNNFWIEIRYKGESHEVTLDDFATTTLAELISHLQQAKDENGEPLFDMPQTDPSGGRRNYSLGRFLDNEKELFNSIRGGIEQTLEDYDVQIGETLFVYQDYVPGNQ
jgi:hypothetical protein